MILSQDHTEISSIRQIHAGDILKICLPDGCVTVRTESEDCIMNEHNAKLHSYAERTETVLLEKTEELETKAKQNHMQIANLFNAMRHSLTAGGKRIRPALIYAFCEVCGGTPEQADTAACAMEMTHTSSLIFDDLPAMDNDDLRRGKPSCHKAFGEATAILAGDALICAPFGLLASDSNLSSEQKLQIIQILSEQEGAGGMIGGQMLDMQFETQEHVTLEELEIMCLGKTGALIKAACQIGCICGGGSPEQIRAAGNYGETLGLAFQMIDDIQDVTSTTEQLGKPVGSDAEEHKTTFVTLLGVDAVRTRAEKLTAQAHEFLTMFDSSGDTCFLHALTDLLLTRIQ